MPRPRSHSPIRSARSYRDYSPPPLPRARSLSRSNVPPFTPITNTAAYRAESSRLYPPDGYRWTLNKPKKANRPWPSEWESDYKRYDKAREKYEDEHKAYHSLRTRLESRDNAHNLRSMFPTESKSPLFRSSETGLYSDAAHRAIREAARTLESAAYDHVKGRHNHWVRWPRSSRTYGQDIKHHSSLQQSWGDHEASARFSREHDFYGTRRRRDSFSTVRDIDRDRERRERSFAYEREKEYYLTLPRLPSRHWSEKSYYR